MNEAELREIFEGQCNPKAMLGYKRSRKGTYVNPAVARDWKWFKMGAAAHEGFCAGKEWAERNEEKQ